MDSLSHLCWLLWVLIAGYLPLIRSQAYRFFFVKGDHSNCLCKTYLAITRHEMTAIFRHLLHKRVCTRVDCASPWLITSQTLVSLTQHREQSIISVRACIQIKHSYKHKNNGCTHVRSAEWCKNGNALILEQLSNEMECKLIDYYCILVQ